MDPEATAETVLEPDMVESESVIIPVHLAPVQEVSSGSDDEILNELFEEPAPQPDPPKVPALYRPQTFVAPKRFIKRHMERGKRKRLLIFVGGALIIVAMSLAIFQTLSHRATTQAAAQTADGFVRAEFSADTEKALKLSDSQTIKENNLRALAMLVTPTLKSHPVRTGQDIQELDDKKRAVFTYRFTITNPQKGSKGSEVPVYIVLLLQKQAGKWFVKSQSMSAVDPKADVASYPAQRFN